MSRIPDQYNNPLEYFLEKNATQGERTISAIRIFFCALIALQFLFIRGGLKGLTEGSTKHIIIFGAIIGIGIFSSLVLIFLKEHHVSKTLRLCSIIADIAGVFALLLPSTIWVSERYYGFLARPDSAIFLILIIGAGFRLSNLVVWLGGTLALLCTGIIIFLDFQINKAHLLYKADSIVIYLILLIGSFLIALSIKKRIINLVREGSKAVIDAEKARQRFGVYISQELVDEALSVDILKPGGKRQSVAVLFSDLRGFTTYSENLDPDKLVNELNSYLEAMVKEIKGEGGVVDKYIGDAIMVVFGIPNPKDSDSVHAVRCAWKMDQALKIHNKERISKGLPELHQGIGIHYGEVVAGNLGTPERLQYTVIGDTVNLASRLESASKDLKTSVVISKDLIDALPDDNYEFTFISCGSIKVKGRDKEINVYTFN